MDKPWCDCSWCVTEFENRQRWDDGRFRQIRTVLQCHALGAEVIALKEPKYERLAALHALETLDKLQREMAELRHPATTPGEPTP